MIHIDFIIRLRYLLAQLSLYGLVFIIVWYKGDDTLKSRGALFNYATRTQADEKFSLHLLSLSPISHSRWKFIIDELIRNWCKEHKHSQATHKVDNHWIKCVNVSMKLCVSPFFAIHKTLRKFDEIFYASWDYFLCTPKQKECPVFISGYLHWIE